DRPPGQLRRRRQRHTSLDDEDDRHDFRPSLTPRPEVPSGCGKAHTPAVARTPLCAVVALLAAVALPSADAAAKGDEHVLIILASGASEPYSVAEVERTANQANAFFELSSFGQVRLRV